MGDLVLPGSTPALWAARMCGGICEWRPPNLGMGGIPGPPGPPGPPGLPKVMPGSIMGLLSWAARMLGPLTWSCMAARERRGGIWGGPPPGAWPPADEGVPWL